MSPTGRQSAFALTLMFVSLSSIGPASGQAPDVASKAAYLSRIAPFVIWPAAAFQSPDSPLSLCIQGNDPFGALLDNAVVGQVVDGRPVVVRRLAKIDANAGCQIAFVAGSPGQSREQALEAVDGAPVLTVTDDTREPAPKGIVHLLSDSGRLRFSVDASQAAHNGVEISSKLLALAVAVRP